MEYCSLTYDGKPLDQTLAGYTTINVEGRGLLDRVLSTVAVDGRDGEVVLSQRLPARTLTVHYHLIGRNNAERLIRLQALHDALHTLSDVPIKFGDEDFTRFGRLTKSKDPPYDQHEGVGSFDLLCADPYKYGPSIMLNGTAIMVPASSVYSYRINSIRMTVSSARTGLTITNATSGRKIIITGALEAGQVIEIRPEQNQLTINGQSAMSRLDYINSDWHEFKVRPGDTISAPLSMTLELSPRAL